MTHGATFFSAVSGASWNDVAPLARLLEVALSPESVAVTPAHARALWKKLSYLGSNDLAYLLRGFEGVDYPEIVRDVCKRLKTAELQPGDEERAVEHNERLVLGKIFADAWQHVDSDERRELLRELTLDEGHLPLSGASVAAAVLSGKAGAFAVYQLSLIVANSVARVLPARRLALGGRKTAQAVALVASLRQAKRAALAETAFSGADAPTETTAAGAQPAKRKAPARKKAKGPRAAPRAAKKKKKVVKAPAQAGGKKAVRKKVAKGGKKKVEGSRAGKKRTAR